MSSLEVKAVAEVKKLRLRPGDHVVIEIEPGLDRFAYEAIHDSIQAEFPENRVVMLVGAKLVKVLTP